MNKIYLIGVEGVTQWPFLVQSCVVFSLLLLLVFSRFSSEIYAKRSFVAINTLLGFAAFYYGFIVGDFLAGIGFALIAGIGIYLCRKSKLPISITNILSIWLVALIAVILCFGMFENVFFTEEIRVNRPFRFLMQWYTLWGGFTLAAIIFSVRYIKRSSLPRMEAWSNVFGVVMLAFWGTCFFFKTIDSYHQANEYVNRQAFDSVTSDVRLGFGVDARDKYGRTLLYKAVQDADFKEVKRLVAEGADLNVQVKRYALRETPLMQAVGKHYEIFIYLIKHGADVNLKSTSSITAGHAPIHAAARDVQDGDLRYVRALLEHGADINNRGMQGMRAIHIAAEGSNTIKGDHFPRLELIEYLVQNGADVNAIAGLGTPLHFAVLGGNIQGVKRLIELGADPTLRSKEGTTPLEAARKLNNIRYGKVADITRATNERRKEIIQYLEQSSKN